MSAVLLKLQPYGMTLTGDGVRPLLLMKDDTGEITFGVPLNPLEAGVTLSQSSRSMVPSTPHKATELLLQSLGMSVSRCVFKEVRLHSLIVELELENHPLGQKTLELRADEAMSLCLHLGVPMFASREFINKSRNYVAEMSDATQGLVLNPKILQRNHPYLM